jgi:ATP-dependent DNA ligase
MKLPLTLKFAAMEAETAAEIPSGDDWQYEPKWDGFRCLVFRDGDDIHLMSKSGQPLARYFPEIVAALQTLKSKRFVLDGELIITVKRTLDFDALLQRIHPAATRIQKLSKETPATLMVFDLLVDDRAIDLSKQPLDKRRIELEKFAAKFLKAQKNIRLSPATHDFSVAKSWFKRMAGPLDGVIAKRIDRPYASGERGDSMLKIKNLRTADCVVGGFRYATKNKQVGSLLLGLYDNAGLLNHVGFTSGIAAADKAKLTKKLEALIQPPGFTGAAPGGPSRWSTGRSADWQPLKTELVVEVQYDHFTGHRFRHGTRLLRWRSDKKPKSCRMDQVKKETESPLTLLD